MTDVQAHLTDIINEHTPSGAEGHVSCWCSVDFLDSFAAHAAHVAAVLQAEFDILPKGELREETVDFVETNNWPLTSADSGRKIPHSRLVSGWKRAEK